MTQALMSLSILGGFLGAGKSTWLRHRLFEQADRPIILLNEMAEVAVDEYLLERAETLKVVAGGCACCERLDEFLAVLHEICNDRTKDGRGEHPNRTILMETSGIAQPARIVRAILDDPVLKRHLRLESVIVAVDARNGFARLLGDGLARSQVESADEIALTKVDVCSPDDLADMIHLIGMLNPVAPVRAYAFGKEQQLPVMPSPRHVSFEFQSDDDPLCSVTLQLGENPVDPSDWHAFGAFMTALLHRHGGDLIRAKGVVASSRGRLLFQSVAGHVQPLELLAGAPSESDNKVVLIGRRHQPERLAAAWQRTRSL
ncbi:GTP-binding protein [Rhizobium sp. 18055]|uniref:CobW family GTP-binding protein n=1 Tax=Rhizobium sp. 18055 TaxID=2681403 RepID=UPI0013573BDD|nr:GTP-binding protein [Rhizobium sp. 18055]